MPPTLTGGSERNRPDLARDGGKLPVLADDHPRQARLGGDIAPDGDDVVLMEWPEPSKRLALGIDDEEREAIVTASLGIVPSKAQGDPGGAAAAGNTSEHRETGYDETGDGGRYAILADDLMRLSENGC